MPELTLKTDIIWTLKADYEGGLVKLLLVSQDGGIHGDYPGLALNEAEWEHLVKWVAYLRAQERLP